MKYAVAAAVFAAVVRAQLESIPECALPCLQSAVADNTDCEVSDIACVCENFDALRADATSCVIDECGPEVAISEVLPATQALCENVGEDTPDTTSSAEEEAPATSTEVETETSVATVPSGTATVAPPAETTAETSSTPIISSTPSPEPTAGAAAIGSMGGLAMVLLGALAL